MQDVGEARSDVPDPCGHACATPVTPSAPGLFKTLFYSKLRHYSSWGKSCYETSSWKG